MRKLYKWPIKSKKWNEKVTFIETLYIDWIINLLAMKRIKIAAIG